MKMKKSEWSKPRTEKLTAWDANGKPRTIAVQVFDSKEKFQTVSVTIQDAEEKPRKVWVGTEPCGLERKAKGRKANRK